MKKLYDYLVLGGGSGGLASAFRASNYKKSIGIIESSSIGGTCVNRGCVPKKLTWLASSFIEDAKIMRSYGFSISLSSSYEEFKSKRDKYISDISKSYEFSLATSKINLIKGHGEFVSNHEIKVGSIVYQSDHILISTGSKPIIPEIPGKEYLKTSDDFFSLNSLPRSVLIIGSGYIAVELAGLFNSFGVDTTISIRGNQLLFKFIDEDIAYLLKANYLKNGIKVLDDSNIKSIDKKGNEFIVEFQNNKIKTFDLVFAAVGRSPNLESLAGTDIKIESGFIWTDDFHNTNIEGVYAVGDATADKKLTPVASMFGLKLADRLFGGQKGLVDKDYIPSVVFSHPPIGTVGLTETQAKELHSNVRVYKTQFNGMFSFASQHKIPTYIKVVCVGDDDRIVGLHGIGRGIDEVIQGFAVSIRKGLTKKDLDDSFSIHPTISEEILSLS